MNEGNPAAARTPPDAIEAVSGRRSVRRFLPTAVPRSTVEAILVAASRAPSGTNSQPWHVHAVAGEARQRLSAAVTAAAKAGRRKDEYPYSPEPIPEPYLARRRKVGYDLYKLYGIQRSDYAARKEAYLRNFEFFGAPVGLFFTMDRALLFGSWLDMGMFMQNVMIVARGHGLETCPQAAWCEYPDVIRPLLQIPQERILVSGMSLGFEERAAPVNALRTEREPLGGFATFEGF
jgi:nitroreductase